MQKLIFGFFLLDLVGGGNSSTSSANSSPQNSKIRHDGAKNSSSSEEEVEVRPAERGVTSSGLVVLVIEVEDYEGLHLPKSAQKNEIWKMLC